jgi:hypothetical protein
VIAFLQTLSDVRVPVLTVVCEPRGRCERHDVESLKRRYSGHMKGPDLLSALVADCPKQRSVYESPVCLEFSAAKPKYAGT